VAEAALRPAEYDRVRRLAYDRFGLALGDGKQELVVSRLGPKLRTHGAANFSAYFDSVERDASGALWTELIDALTTNHTSFFREIAHFEHLRDHVLPALPALPQIWIWCAASSSGEEPYSLAMWLREYGPAGTQFRILATDISTRVLEAAREGIYSESKIREVPVEWQQKYLLRGEGKRAGYFKLRPEVRAMVQFERFNLVEAPFRQEREFPVIFCRNVMIYFDAPTQETLVANLARHLWPGGYLYAGHSESLSRLRHPLQFRQPAVYQEASGVLRGPGR